MHVLNWLGGAGASTFAYDDLLPVLAPRPVDAAVEEILDAVCPFVDEASKVKLRAEAGAFCAGAAQALDAELRVNGDLGGRSQRAMLASRASALQIAFMVHTGRMEVKATQCAAAAHCVTSHLAVAASVRNGTYERRVGGGGVVSLDMSQLHTVYASTRVPGLGGDTLVTHASATHIVVSVGARGALYAMDTVDAGGTVLPRAAFEAAFEAMAVDAERSGGGSNAGILTALDRDTWAELRIELVGASAANAASVSTIESALLAVHLDTAAAPSLEAASTRALAGAGGMWLDKSTTVLVFADGYAMQVYEHTAADGIEPVSITVGMCNPTGLDVCSPVSAPPPPFVALPLDTSAPRIASAVAGGLSAMAEREALITASVTPYTGYGKAAIKAVGVSPAAWVVAAVLTAALIVSDRFDRAMQPVTLRLFRGGRIGAAERSMPAMQAFAEALDIGGEAEALRLLLDAASAEYAATSHTCMVHSGLTDHMGALRDLAAPSVPPFLDWVLSVHTPITISTGIISPRFEGKLVGCVMSPPEAGGTVINYTFCNVDRAAGIEEILLCVTGTTGAASDAYGDAPALLALIHQVLDEMGRLFLP